MKTLSEHIQESFKENKEEQTIVENLNDNKENVVNEDATIVEQEKPSE